MGIEQVKQAIRNEIDGMLNSEEIVLGTRGDEHDFEAYVSLDDPDDIGVVITFPVDEEDHDIDGHLYSINEDGELEMEDSNIWDCLDSYIEEYEKIDIYE